MRKPKLIDMRDDTNFREVVPGLYLGGMLAPRYAEGRFKTVIDLYARDWPDGMPKSSDTDLLLSETRLALVNHVDHYLSFKILDGKPYPPGLLDTVYETVRARRESGVLIHCFAGISRSVSAMYAMLCVLEGIDDDEASVLAAHPAYVPMAQPLMSAIRWVDEKLAKQVKQGKQGKQGK